MTYFFSFTEPVPIPNSQGGDGSHLRFVDFQLPMTGTPLFVAEMDVVESGDAAPDDHVAGGGSLARAK